MSKEDWFRHFERAVNDGVPYDKAAEVARQRQIDERADKTDRAKKIERGE